MSQESGTAITSVDGGVRISVHAQPGAKKTEVAGLHGGAVKIRIQAPPLEGRANDELIRFLAEALDVPRAHVTLYRGEKSRTKIFSIVGVDPVKVRHALLG